MKSAFKLVFVVLLASYSYGVYSLNGLSGTDGGGLLANNDIEIIGEGIDGTGITSAYQSHKFYIKDDGLSVSDYRWEYKLPLASGEYEVVSTSSSKEFIIPAIVYEDKYQHSIEGEILGLVVFSGVVDGQTVKATYNLTLDLKPHILSTSIVSITPSLRTDTYYDVVIDVYYEGSHYVHSTIEEEYGSIVNAAFSDTPYYARLDFTDVDLRGRAWVNIVLRNDYGEDRAVWEIPSMTTGVESLLKNENIDIKRISVYSLSGTFLGNANSKSEASKMGKGLLVLKCTDVNGNCWTEKVMGKTR